MNNKKIKQSILDAKLKGRKLFWFGEFSEKFLANSIEDVIDQHREWIGDQDVDDIVSCGDLGEVSMTTSDWWKVQCWNEDTGKMELNISAIYGDGLV